jgi:hypothetical protein
LRQTIYLAQEMGKSVGPSKVLQRKVQERVGNFLLLYLLLKSRSIEILLNEFKYYVVIGFFKLISFRHLAVIPKRDDFNMKQFHPVKN